MTKSLRRYSQPTPWSWTSYIIQTLSGRLHIHKSPRLMVERFDPLGTLTPQNGQHNRHTSLRCDSYNRHPNLWRETENHKTDHFARVKQETEPQEYPKMGHLINTWALDVIYSKKCSTKHQETENDMTGHFTWDKRQTDPPSRPGSNYPKTGHLINTRAPDLIPSQKFSTICREKKTITLTILHGANV